MLINLKSLSPVLVMISSISVTVFTLYETYAVLVIVVICLSSVRLKWMYCIVAKCRSSIEKNFLQNNKPCAKALCVQNLSDKVQRKRFF